MKLLDLFTGTGSVRVAAEALGYEVTSLDIDPRCNPDFVADITLFDYTVWNLGEFDVVWSSPPCLYFSAARRSNLGRMVKGEIMTKETLLRDTEMHGAPLRPPRAARPHGTRGASRLQPPAALALLVPQGV